MNEPENTNPAILGQMIDENESGTGLPAVTSDDNGDVLTVVEGEWAKASPSSGENFVVTFVTEDYSTVTVDKTYAEIVDAFNAGANVIAYLDLTALDSGINVALLANVLEDNVHGMVSFYMLTASGNGETLTSLIYTALTVTANNTAGMDMLTKSFS